MERAGVHGIVAPKISQRSCEGVVHHRVVLVAAQPADRVEPDLAQQEKLVVFPLQRRAQLPQKQVRKLVAHVKADAVYAVVARPVQAQLGKVPPHLRIVGVQLWHGRPEREGVVPSVGGGEIVLEKVVAVDEEPVEVARVPAVFADVLPREELGAAVVEHRVQHNADAQLVSVLHQRLQVVLAAEVGVYGVVVKGVVFVVGVRQEDRCQIQSADAQPA